MNYLEARKKWESIKDLRELNVFEYELIITALLERITQLEAAQQSVQRTALPGEVISDFTSQADFRVESEGE